jgi:hypothetical protein
MTFINRVHELGYLRGYFATEPNSILVVYGPKSCGKTTLMMRVVESLDTEQYAVNYIDVRRVLITNFKSFLNVFFPKNLKEKVKDIFSGITLNTGFFSIGLDDEAALEQNPFKVMEDKLAAARQRGVRPVLVIDEIQLLRHIYMNGERYLLDELLNFFVAITKVTKTAHVVLLSSDSYFIENVYNSAKLVKTSDLFFVNHFEENTVRQWLGEEGFDQKETDIVWKYLGGCAWEINELIRKKSLGEKVDAICQQMIEQYVGPLQHSVAIRSADEETVQLYREITAAIAKKSAVKPAVFGSKASQVRTIAETMISKDLWFFKVASDEITANSKSIWWAMKKLIHQKQPEK